MACLHKFYDYLRLERLDFEPTTLIIGTFNPSWPAGNSASWFYGRTDNNFWEVLPRLYQEKTMKGLPDVDWKLFCKRHRIAITDMIASINDADESNALHSALLKTYKDDDIEKFYDFEMVNLVGILRRYPTITNVYVTRTISQRFWKTTLWAVSRYCKENQIPFKSIMTPSNWVYMQVSTYNKINPNDIKTIPDFILMRWKEVWHDINPNIISKF